MDRQLVDPSQDGPSKTSRAWPYRLAKRRPELSLHGHQARLCLFKLQGKHCKLSLLRSYGVLFP